MPLQFGDNELVNALMQGGHLGIELGGYRQRNDIAQQELALRRAADMRAQAEQSGNAALNQTLAPALATPQAPPTPDFAGPMQLQTPDLGAVNPSHTLAAVQFFQKQRQMEEDKRAYQNVISGGSSVDAMPLGYLKTLATNQARLNYHGQLDSQKKLEEAAQAQSLKQAMEQAGHGPEDIAHEFHRRKWDQYLDLTPEDQDAIHQHTADAMAMLVGPFVRQGVVSQEEAAALSTQVIGGSLDIKQAGQMLDQAVRVKHLGLAQQNAENTQAHRQFGERIASQRLGLSQRRLQDSEDQAGLRYSREDRLRKAAIENDAEIRNAKTELEAAKTRVTSAMTPDQIESATAAVNAAVKRLTGIRSRLNSVRPPALGEMSGLMDTERGTQSAPAPRAAPKAPKMSVDDAAQQAIKELGTSDRAAIKARVKQLLGQ